MKILYCILPLLIWVASPSFAQNSTFQSNYRFDIYKQTLSKDSNQNRSGRKNHRGSGRRSYYIDNNY